MATDISKHKALSISEVAKLINVSTATIRNWIKTGVISSSLNDQDVNQLKSSIEKGQISRLNTRANKRNSKRRFLPEEYIGNLQLRNTVQGTKEICLKYRLSLKDSIYLVSLAYLEARGEFFYHEETFKFSQQNFRRKTVYAVLREMKPDKCFNLDVFNDLKNILTNNNLSIIHDFLGVIYQSLLLEGNKSASGSYYTPNRIVKDTINSLGLSQPIESFLDPCCGTGSFMIEAAIIKKLKFKHIYGIDKDSIAVIIAKINLLMLFQKIDEQPHIYCLDSLNEITTADKFCKDNNLLPGFDSIATNPPWGAGKNTTHSKKYEVLLESHEIFSMFIIKSLELLKPFGEAAFILPASILNVKNHRKIREILCHQHQIIKIKELGRAFTGVFTPVIQLNLRKALPGIENKLKVITPSKTYEIKQERFCKNQHCVFDIGNDDLDNRIIMKTFSMPHVTLKNHAKWALGIVTGNNSHFLKSVSGKDLEPIFKGSDIDYFKLKEPTSYIKFDRHKFQQVTKDEFFRAEEKLVYKFISSKLVFAYDHKQSLTLNSANILIPQIPGLSIKVVLGFLNSSVFQFIFLKKFSTHKILRGDLEQLPFPDLNEIQKNKIEIQVNKIISGKALPRTIDRMIYDCFNLNEEEQKHIIDSIFHIH